MAIYKGAAFCDYNNGTGTRSFRVGLDDQANPASLVDGITWRFFGTQLGLTFYFRQSTSGITPPAAANTIYVTLYDASTVTIVDSTSFSGDQTERTFTLYATYDGLPTGERVFGDLRLYIRAERTSLGSYDVNSDTQGKSGFIQINPDTPAFDLTHNGGSDPASYGDTLTAMLDFPYRLRNSSSRQMEFRYKDVGSGLDYLQTVNVWNSSLGQFRDTELVDNTFDASLETVRVEAVAKASAIAPTSAPNEPWINFNAQYDPWVTDNTLPVDPRLTVDHHMQKNNNSYATPPGSLDINPKNRLTSDLAFLSFRITNARGEGENGLTVTESLTDTNGLVAALSHSVITATKGGEDGWGDAFLTWNDSLPGGGWDHLIDITSPSIALSLEANATEQFSLLAINPAYTILVGLGAAAAGAQTDHVSPGTTLLVGIAVYDSASKQLISLDSSPTPSVVIGRFNVTTGQAEYLESDLSWVALTNPATAYEWPLSQSGGDPKVWVTTLDTSGFGYFTIFAVGKGNVGGTPYQNFICVEILDNKTVHSIAPPVIPGPAFDALSFALHGVIGQR